MATIYHEADERYQLQSQNDEVTVWAKLGDGQGGAYVIFRNEVFLKANGTAKAGKAGNLEDAIIQVTATVKDKLEETNWTSATVYIREGDRKEVKFGAYQREVAKHLDTVVYVIKIKLYR